MRKRTKRKVLAALIPLLLLAVLLLIRWRMAPLMRQFVVTQAQNTMSSIVSGIINEEIASGSINYDKIIYFEKDASGKVAALKTDMSEVNRMKTQILAAMGQEIQDVLVEDLNIPIGNFFFSEFFSGKGFDIPVRVLSISTTDATFKNQFYEAGINQTLHQIRLYICVNLSVLTPTGTIKTDVVTDVVVAETVLVGAVPEQYVTIGETTQGGADP